MKKKVEFRRVAKISYSKLLDPVSDIIALMESLLAGAFGKTSGDQRECYKRIHAYSWGLHTLVMDVITALGLENAATRPAVLERFKSLNHPIKATLDNLAAGFDGPLTEEQSGVIDYAVAAILSIEHSMSNLWQYSLLKHQKQVYADEDFDGVALLQKLQATLKADPLPALRRPFRLIGDERCLTYAFGEIAHNIRQHAGVDSASIQAQDYGYRADITIYDRGKGFRLHNSQLAFQPFWQAEANDPGLGLGLYLAKDSSKAAAVLSL